MFVQMTKETDPYTIKTIEEITEDIIDEEQDTIRVRYRLLSLGLSRETYIVVLESNNEFAAECLGVDISEAKSVFDAISRGRVTPMFLEDVVRDMELCKFIKK